MTVPVTPRLSLYFRRYPMYAKVHVSLGHFFKIPFVVLYTPPYDTNAD